MKKLSILARALVLATVSLLTPMVLAGELDSFLRDVGLRASADLGSFKADLSLTFGVSAGKVDGLFRIASSPADVYMCLRVGEVAKQPIDRVVAEYERSKGQGWGAIAKNLGIAPGSPEFHALKANRMSGQHSPASHAKGGKGRG